MGRNKANNKKVAPGASKPKTPLNQSKKAKNVFKVANSSKGKGKKPKEVQGKLKQVSVWRRRETGSVAVTHKLELQIKEAVKDKQEKLDASLKTLHKDMVVKKPKAAVAPIKDSRKKPANAKKVSETLGKLKF
ncbi:hypothetical protein KR054_011556 [Drosophila jambulina]|nr:hypothetical protein KR054_011556 [Drosophila jambulina]